MLKYLLLSFSIGLFACARIPDVSTNYYLTKSSLRVDLTRALSCDPGGRVQITNAVSPIVSNSADFDYVKKLDFSKFQGNFTDPDISVTFFTDGRLKSINSTQTGTARQIVESTLAVAITAFPQISNLSESGEEEPQVDLCDYIKTNGNAKTKILTLQYSNAIAVSKPGGQPLKPVGATQVYHADIFGGNSLPSIHTHSEDLRNLDDPVDQATVLGGDVLWARHLTRVSLRLFAEDAFRRAGPVWDGAVLMALPGTEYRISIPNPPAFGKQQFQVVFSDSGALEILKYGSQSGASDAAGLAGSVVSQLQETPAAEQAAALKAEADLIAQRERLTRCQANPSECL